MAKAQEPDARPDVKRSMKELLVGLREKFSNIGMPQPKGQLVEAVLVEEEFLESVLEEVKELGLSVYTATRDFDGVKLPGGALFVRDSATQLPIGALEAPPIRYSSMQRLPALDVWSIVPKDEPTPEEVAEEEATMKRYFEGLAADNDAEYVPPPKSRLRYLMGLENEDQDCLQVEKGQVLARILPPNPLLWARAIMQRRKEAGSEVPSYRLKSDSEAVSPSS